MDARTGTGRTGPWPRSCNRTRNDEWPGDNGQRAIVQTKAGLGLAELRDGAREWATQKLVEVAKTMPLRHHIGDSVTLLVAV